MTDFAHLNDYILLAHLKLQNLLMFTYVHFTKCTFTGRSELLVTTYIKH